MWDFNSLVSSYTSMKQGNWSTLNLGDVQALVEYQQDNFENFEQLLTQKQIKVAKQYITELGKYRDERGKSEVSNGKPSPTEMYKVKFGKKPTDAYKAEHNGKFDKVDYAKWLRNATKNL